MTKKYHVVATTSELEEGGQKFIDLEGEEILLVKHDGEYYAIAYLCSHAEFGLEGRTASGWLYRLPLSWRRILPEGRLCSVTTSL